MKKSTFFLTAALFILFLSCAREQATQTKGQLLIIGGGKRPASVMQKFVDLAGGNQAKIAIIPMASEYYQEAGERYEKEFQDLGAEKATAFYIMDSVQANADSVIEQLNQYNAIFFGGGDQSRLTKIFLNTRSMDLFHKKYRQGAVIGGTSAGAAIMSEIMITGDGDWQVLKRDSVDTTEGFSFLKSAVVDQHFFRRQRLNRLLAVVIQNHITGVGIDESTAVWVQPNGLCQVLGNSVVLIIHPPLSQDKGQSDLLTGKGLSLDILKDGDTFILPMK